MSKETLQLYAASLSEFPDEDLRAVFQHFADMPRREGETAMPSRGEIKQQLRIRANERNLRLRSEREREKFEGWFLQWVAEQTEATGKSEQEILDSIKAAGYTGRKARDGA